MLTKSMSKTDMLGLIVGVFIIIVGFGAVWLSAMEIGEKKSQIPLAKGQVWRHSVIEGKDRDYHETVTISKSGTEISIISCGNEFESLCFALAQLSEDKNLLMEDIRPEKSETKISNL